MGIMICRIIVCVLLGYGLLYDIWKMFKNKMTTSIDAISRFAAWLIYASAIYLILN